MSFTLWVKIKRFWMRHGVSSGRHCQWPWRGGGWGNLRASLLSRLVTCKRPREFPWGCCLRLTSVLNGSRRLSKWFSRRAVAFKRMRTVLNSLVPKMSDWAEEAWNRAQILPTSLTGDVTPDIAEDDREQGWFFNSLQPVTRFYREGGRSKSVTHFKQIKDIRKCLRGPVWKLKILKRATKTFNNH